MSTVEEWRPLGGYEGFYEVSNLGRVRSVDRLIERAGRWGRGVALLRGRVLKQTPNENGYLRVDLARDGETTTARVNRLVAKAFLGNPEEGKNFVCHRNGIPADNDATNLRWDDQKGNMSDTVLHGTLNRGVRHGLSKLTESEVRAMRDDYASGLHLQRELAQKYKVSRSNVSTIVTGKHWGHVPNSPQKEVA